eukprot:12937217-Prorocentrum_lima.AAC.1
MSWGNRKKTQKKPLSLGKCSRGVVDGAPIAGEGVTAPMEARDPGAGVQASGYPARHAYHAL